MEVVRIIYRVIAHESLVSTSDEVIPNMMEIKVTRGKEVYLIDFIKYLERCKLGSEYIFYADTGSGPIIPLPSYASVLPVMKDGSVNLLLIKSMSSPYVPLYHMETYMTLSRKVIYSKADYSETMNFRLNNNSHRRSNDDVVKTVKASSSSSVNNRGDIGSTTKKNVSNFNQHSNNYSSNAHKHNHNNNNSHSNNNNTDDTLNNITDNIDKAAKSFFSFTKNIIDVTTSNINMNMSNMGSVLSSLASTSNDVYTNKIIQLSKSRVSIIKLLADGGFGSVYLVKEESNNKQYALKILNCQSKEQIIDGQHEIKSLQKFDHKNIINLVDYSILNNQGNTIINILFPLYSNGTVWNKIENNDGIKWPFPERIAINIILGVSHALNHIHKKGYCHRDMKPHNILLTDDYNPILMDFGSVTTARHNISNRKDALDMEELAANKTSAPYRPPELTAVNYPSTIDERVDVWGLGCTMFCMAFGYSPFETPKEGLSKLAILNANYKFPNGNKNNDCIYSRDYTNLISTMLQLDPANRPFTQDIIETIGNYS